MLAELPWGTLGLTVCYDLRFPHLYRALAKAGADFLAIPSAFTRQTGEAHWHVLMRARAIENGCFVFAAAQAGKHEVGRETYGHSLIVSPWGEILAEADGVHPSVIVADVRSSDVQQARQRIPSLQHDRPFQVVRAAGDAGKGSLMIRYRLKCKKGHEFEAWFANSAAFDTQEKRGLLSCAHCGTSKVSKALMAPRIAKGGKAKAAAKRARESDRGDGRRGAAKPETQRVAAHRELAAAMRKLRAEVEAKSEYVGPRFSEEARKIHYEEVPARGIHGEATADEAKALKEEGIEFFPLPTLPEDRN